MSLFFVLLASWVIGKQMATVSKTLFRMHINGNDMEKESERTTNKKSILILKL